MSAPDIGRPGAPDPRRPAGRGATPKIIFSVPGELAPAMLEQAVEPIGIEIGRTARENIERCRGFVERCLEEHRPIYGTSTGFGPQVNFPGRSTTVDQCDNVLQHLTAGQGPHLDPALARACILARTWSLAKGRSGVSLSTIDALVTLLGTRYAPAIPCVGSVGASGDLVPLAHAVQGMRGHGLAYFDNELMSASEALARAGLAPISLDGRDALALVNGTSVSVAAGGIALCRIRRSLDVAQMLTATMMELLGCAAAPFEDSLLRAYGHPGARRAAARMRKLLRGSTAAQTRPLQEPYSIRCSPQLLGAVDDLLGHAASILTDDLNGVSDNPLFFPEEDLVAHGGNFFGQPLAFASDMLALAATQMGNLAERQLDLMVDPHRNGGLAPMLSVEPGRQHGVQGVQLVATAIVAGMRRTAAPASIQSIPTNLHNQDVIPLATHGALNALELAESLWLLHGCLAVTLRQAAYVGGRKPAAPAIVRILAALSEAIAPIDPDRALDEDLRSAARIMYRLAG